MLRLYDSRYFVRDSIRVGVALPGFRMTLLYLDFDAPEDIDALEKRIDLVAELVQVDLEMREVHPTKRGCHVIVAAKWPDKPNPQISQTPEVVAILGPDVIEGPDLTPVEIVCLQILLGSDMQREAFNLLRAHSLGDAPEFWRDRWNVLFSEKL